MQESTRDHAASPDDGGFATAAADGNVRHRRIRIDGMDIFYREAGRDDAPALLLPHGYPCSSFQFRRLLPALADRWRLLAPDFPGFGYSDTPADGGMKPDFDGYTTFLQHFADALRLERFALWLHDYGSQIGLRLAIRQPQRITALVIQNGDIYEDQLGPRYEAIRRYWSEPTEGNRAHLEAAVSREGFRAEFEGGVEGGIEGQLRDRLTPDLWELHWSLMNTPARRSIAVSLMEGLEENLRWFPRYQAYLREHRPPTLIVWGPQDGYMPEGAARAYLRDLPDAELHLLDGGHWLLETHFDEVVPLVRDFLGRVHAGKEPVRRSRSPSGRPAIARIWRGRTTSEKADHYQPYLYQEGIRPLEEKALGVELLREDRPGETEFVTISWWESVDAMSRFTGGDPNRIHHLARDAEFLIELPESVQVLQLVAGTSSSA